MENNTIKLTEAQIEMLKLSDNDIESGNLISHEQLNEMDLEWLNNFPSEQAH